MKRAKVVVVAVAVNCPNPDCGVDQPEPSSGSLTWEVSMIATSDKVHTCDTCQTQFVVALPKTVRM